MLGSEFAGCFDLWDAVSCNGEPLVGQSETLNSEPCTSLNVLHHKPEALRFETSPKPNHKRKSGPVYNSQSKDLRFEARPPVPAPGLAVCAWPHPKNNAKDIASGWAGRAGRGGGGGGGAGHEC